MAPGAANAVNDVTLELPLGKTLGIIGGTGSGKSTLVSLIPRLYDASTGSVYVMGSDVRAWQLDQLRHVVATVPQRASLVSGTIRSNLTWRDESATDEELWAALDMAQASEFVHNKPQGPRRPGRGGRQELQRRTTSAPDHRTCPGGRSAGPDHGRLRLGTRL